MRALKIAAGATLAWHVPAIAQTAPPRAAPVPRILVVASRFPSRTELRSVAPVGDTKGWIIEADFPESIRNDSLGRKAGPFFQVNVAQIGIEVTVETDDSISDCRGIYGSVDLAPDLCTLIRKRGRFRHALALDGSPVRGTTKMTIQYSMGGPDGPARLPAAPPRPTDEWPVRWTGTGVRLVSQPTWSGPANEAQGEFEVGVVLTFDKDHPDSCQAIYYGGEGALKDRRSCEVARGATYAINNPNDTSILALIVRWSGGQPLLIAPIRRQAQGATLADGALRVRGLPDPKTLSPDAEIFVAVLETGAVASCRVSQSAGTDQADVEMCRQALRMRFHPTEDVFGRPIKDVVTAKVRFG